MGRNGKMILLWVSLVLMVISAGTLIYFSSLQYSRKIEDYSTATAILLFIFSLNLVTLFGLKFQEKRWLIISGILSTILLLPINIVFFIGIEYEESSNLLLFILLVLMCLSDLFAVIYLFIIRKPGELRTVLVLLFVIVVFVVWNRLKLPYILEDELRMVSILITTAGIYMFGLRCLFIIDKNRYLKFIAFIACTFTAFGCFLFMLKISGNNITMMELVYFIPTFLLTLIVLLSLPVTGYIGWPSIHKKILKKIAVAWIFVLLIFSIRFIYPDLFKVMVFRQEVESTEEFWLDDYNIPDKNGLETE